MKYVDVQTETGIVILFQRIFQSCRRKCECEKNYTRKWKERWVYEVRMKGTKMVSNRSARKRSGQV